MNSKTYLRCVCICCLIFCLMNCKTKNDADFFNGEITVVNDIEKPTFLYGEQVVLNDIYTGAMTVCDSIIFFTSEKYPDYFISIFSLNTGNLLGNFCSKGQGPGEYIAMPINTSQFEISDTSIKVWIDARYNNKQALLNITSSIRNNNTTIDSIIPFGLKNDPYSVGFVLDNVIAAKSSSSDESDTYLKYDIYNIKDLNKIKSYTIYHSPVTVKRGDLHTPYYLASSDKIKPDKTKIAMGMWMLNQINILDVATGIVKGYRIEGSMSFCDMNDVSKNVKYANRCISVDDRYIYSLYVGQDVNEDGISHFFAPASQINVFDWNGDYVEKIIIDKSTQFIELDPVNKIVYTIDNEETVYRYDLSYLY